MTSADEHPLAGTERTPLTPVLARAVKDLAAAGVASPRVDAELLAAHVLGVGRGRLPLVASMRLDERDRFAELLARRIAREPLQHLLGTAAFRHIEVAVGPGVFVPRPETELLAGWGVDAARAVVGGAVAGGAVAGGAVVVDLCSGSGAIALSVAHEVPTARVTAVERAEAALVWLRRNAADRAAAGDPPIRVLPGDVTDPALLAQDAGTVDVLLCNPPYVPSGTPVPDEVLDFDPAEAVFAGADGLEVIGPVVALAATLLRPGGVVGIEHDDVHGSAVPDLLRADGRFTDVTAHEDLTGRPRYATARRTT